ncbi:alpha/beta-hydrolase [Aspergillus ellipticus CBS 707.79]|uniref:Alpha/beta-hydrolase n=1 Tax=Aspergillus ellipticus CBS 707.79 TaxID=1448320 RepID=A0A319EGB3_9EURO|nr:alpha/beta-hydrolase [Aspergillus ellipticus CBS 707.79]
MPSLPTILFVPGAWHSPECLRKVVDRLEGVGSETDPVHLLSTGPAQHLLDFTADVAHIRGHIQRLVNADKNVVVVAQSYGGVPSNEAIEGLAWATRQGNGQDGGVIHIFCCCSAFGGDDLPWLEVSGDRLEAKPTTPDKIFYNAMPDIEVRNATDALKPHSYPAFHSPCTYAAWKDVPSTYLYCLKNAAIPLPVQKMMVEEWAQGYPIGTESVDASHSPFYSVPDEVTAAIRRAAGEDI